MGRNKKVNIDEFYTFLVVNKHTRAEAMAHFSINKDTYYSYTKECKEMQIFDTTTTSIEREALRLYRLETDPKLRAKYFEYLMKIWEKKQNVIDTSEKEEDKLDMSIFANMGDPTAASN